MDEFANKVVLITAAGRGIGREIALAFSSLGVRVAANDINPLNLDETVNQIQQIGGTARGFVFDIAKRMPVEAMVTQVTDHFDRLDYLVNNTAVDPDVAILDMDEWEFHRTLDVNLAGPFFCTQLVGRVMRQLGGGAMVNILSGPRTEPSHRGHSARSTSQVGLVGLTCTAAAELAAFNIRLNAVGYATSELEMVVSRKWETNLLKRWRDSYPMLRLGEHPDLVSLVLFLCSDASAALTGQVLFLEPNT